MDNQTKRETHFTDNPAIDATIKIIILLAFIAGICYGLWWLGNWIWDVIGALFEWLFGGGSGGGGADPYQKLNDCYDKHPDDIAAYRSCVRR